MDSSMNTNYLNSIEGIQFDGKAFALFDPNFKIENTLTVSFQLQTFAHNGLLMWLGDPYPDSSFTVEIQNKQLVARVVANGQPFSVRTEFTKNRLCDGIWHFIHIRLDGNLLSMKVDKRNFMKTEPRCQNVEMRGPLFIAGYSEQYQPSYLSVRVKDFFRGNLRNLKINEKPIDWLTPKMSGISSATPEFHNHHPRLSTLNSNFSNIRNGGVDNTKNFQTATISTTTTETRRRKLI